MLLEVDELWDLYVRKELRADATPEEFELARHAFHMGIYVYVKVRNDQIERGDPEGALEEIQKLARAVALAQEEESAPVQ